MAAATILVLTGCSKQTVGQVGPRTESDVASESATTSASSSVHELSGEKLCDLLNQDELNSLGLDKVGQGDAVDRPDCRWRKPAPEGYMLSVTYYDDLKFDDVRNASGKLNPITVGSHKGVRYKAITGAISAISLKLTEVSSVAITVTDGSDKGSDLVTKYAKVIEPRLPGGAG